MNEVMTDEEILPLYLMSVAKDSKSKASLITSALSFYGKKKTKGMVSSISPYLNLVTKAIGKRAPPVKHKEQVTVEELMAFFPLARSPDKVKSRIGTLVITLFAGLFRPSEALNLLIEDLEFGKEDLKINLKKSKSNQNGPPEYVFIKKLNNDRCPVRILEEWMTKIPNSKFLFPSFTGKERPWSYDAALKGLKQTLMDLDIRKKITLHSFRGSAATAAIDAGCSEAELDRGARWNSITSKRSYVKRSAKSTTNVSAILRDNDQ